MIILELIRLEETTDSGTLGVLKINKSVFCYTLEPADVLNETNISSIPAQQYQVVWHQSPKYGWVYKVDKVPHRTDVLIHTGNVATETRGCILLGQGIITGPHLRLTNSRVAYNAFIDTVGQGQTMHLTIREVY